MAPPIPVVEVAHQGHALGAGRPYRKGESRHALHHGRVRAQLFVQALVAALGQQPDIGFAQHLAETIRVFDVQHRVVPGHPQAIVEAFAPARDAALEHAIGMHALQGGD